MNKMGVEFWAKKIRKAKKEHGKTGTAILTNIWQSDAKRDEQFLGLLGITLIFYSSIIIIGIMAISAPNFFSTSTVLLFTILLIMGFYALIKSAINKTPDNILEAWNIIKEGDK